MRNTIAAALLLLCLAYTRPAAAHPHVWVVVKAEAMLADDGKIKAIRHHWTFDDMYSAFVTANLGKDGKDPTTEDLQPVAQTNVDSLKEFDYFTFSKLNGKKIVFDPPTDYSMTYNPTDQTATLHFTLPLDKPAPTNKSFSFSVYDPTYFVAFAFDKGSPVHTVGAPQDCKVTVVKPRELDQAETQKLSEAYFQNMSPGEDFGIKLADRAIIACP